MKTRSFLISLIFSASVLASLAATSCSRMNDINQGYYDKGESIYIGKVETVSAQTGFEKVRFTMGLNSDPRISKIIIYWNDRAESISVDVNRMESGPMTVEYETAMPEGNYVFEFVTMDKNGNTSLSSELSLSVYGNTYSGKLRNRLLASYEWSLNGLVLSWESISSAMIQYTTVEYMSGSEKKTVQVSNDDMETVIPDITSSTFSVSTSFCPDGCFDVFNAVAQNYDVPEYLILLDKSKFSENPVAGDHTSTIDGVRRLNRIWDGITSNPYILHSASSTFPFMFTFDMGCSSTLKTFRLWPRTSDAAFSAHNPKSFELWASNDLTKPSDDSSYWGTDDWKNDWVKLLDEEIAKPASDIDTVWKEGFGYDLDPTLGKFRYIRLIIKSNWGETSYVTIGEVSFWGDPR